MIEVVLQVGRERTAGPDVIKKDSWEIRREDQLLLLTNKAEKVVEWVMDNLEPTEEITIKGIRQVSRTGHGIGGLNVLDKVAAMDFDKGDVPTSGGKGFVI